MWGSLSLTRSRVCSFQLLLGLASASFLRSEYHGTREHILLSLFFRLPQPGGPGSCIHFPQEEGSPVIPPVLRDSYGSGSDICGPHLWGALPDERTGL
jgi:hypothetical protein